MITTSQLSENSHRGFEGLKAALCLGSTGVKSNTAVGMQLRLRRNGIGSRSSGKERDAETGLDFFLARYYSGAEGRFMTPDWSAKPEPVPYAKLNNPQTLNLYAYVQNNPSNRIDLDCHADFLWQRFKNVVIGKGWITDAQVKGWSVEQVARNHRYSNEWVIAEFNRSGKDTGHPHFFKFGANKCNEFVGDTLAEAGKKRPEIKDKDGNIRMPSSNEMANPKIHIPGYSDPRPLSEARPGDIIAQQHGPVSGHAGIVVMDNGELATASANFNKAGQVDINNWGFRPAGQNGESDKDRAPVVRHPE
jgi:RHS repeat-associated protein